MATTHSDKGLTTLRMMGTLPESWKLAEIDWKEEEREIDAKVTCPTCHGRGRVQLNAQGEAVEEPQVLPENFRHHPHGRALWCKEQGLTEGKCPTCPGRRNWPSHGTGEVWGRKVAKVWVGYPRWTPGTQFDSRFSTRACACELCNKTVLKSNLVPVQGVDTEGNPHGMWVGGDCARKFLAVDTKTKEDRFFETGRE